MYRGNFGGAAAAASVGEVDPRLESMKRQFEQSQYGGGGGGGGLLLEDNFGNAANINNNHNGIPLTLREQYEQHEAEQAAKRQRLAAGGGTGGNNNTDNHGGMGSFNIGASGSPHLADRARMFPQQGFPGMSGMGVGATGMGAPGAAGMGGPPDNDLAAAMYFNEQMNAGGSYSNPRGGFPGTAGLGGFGSFGGATPALGLFNQGAFPDYGRLAAAQGHSLGGLGGYGSQGPAGMTGIPANRRAQIMALMDMENELQQEAAARQQQQLGGFNMMGGNGMANIGRLREAQDPDGIQRPQQEPSQVATFSTSTTPALQMLPPVMEEGAAPHFSQRNHIPLGIDEDNNWLTEFQCFIRFDLIEVVQASRHADQQANKEGFHQIGIRCRYCAHIHPGQRASRSSAFPSSIRQLYQSFTMMLRDHFEQCSEIPKDRKRLFSELKAKNSQGAYDSKQYWIYSAEKLGMVESDHGIQMTLESQAKARRKPPFGTCADGPNTQAPPKLLVSPEDFRITSDFLYTLMSQVQVVHLIESERVGKRKTLRVGLPGFGCRYCCHAGRCGLSRMFPLRRRMLPGKIREIYDHIKRCTLFPVKEKELLERLKREDRKSPEQEKEFFDRVWERLGCESEVQK